MIGSGNDAKTGRLVVGSESKELLAEVISIGDEMTSGARLDTNAQWLSQRLGDLGVHVAFHSTVGDNLQHNIDVFRCAVERADIVVATGGLGPTRDDLTREALAGLAQQPLQLSPSALQHIESLFARRRREMPERNRVQAMFPAGSEEIFNPQGTAPGIDLQIPCEGRPSRVFSLPGVPAEMKRMFDETVAPRILQQAGGANHIQHLVMKFFGTGESDMEQRLGEMIARDRQPRVGITVSEATISLRITATADSDQKCKLLIESTRAEIMELVGDLHFGDGEKYEQYHAIDDALCTRGERLMVVELGNAAPLGNWFAALGETDSYLGGLSFATTADLLRLTDTDDIKIALEQLRQRFETDWVLMVDAYPSLDAPDDAPLPASTIRLVVTDPAGRQLATNTTLGGHPAILQQRIAKAAMAWFRQIVAKTP